MMTFFLLYGKHISHTSEAAGNHAFIDMLMTSRFQGIQKATEYVDRVLHDNVNQLLGCLDGFTALRLNGLQVLQCERVKLKHVASNVLCFKFLRYFRVQATQHISVS